MGTNNLQAFNLTEALSATRPLFNSPVRPDAVGGSYAPAAAYPASRG
ncbi:hypothetical protein CpOVICCA32_0663 [Corynebacterium pseudotuberculosis]|nr:hypothetical protein CpOVICCA32_0663 [Corynebacterium pseudotuberculosis]